MKELAEFLKNERLNRNLTVEALSRLSGISVGMLESFEQCRFERFSAPLFLRNTIRAYCEALHIEAGPLIQKYSFHIEACSIQDAGIKRYGRQQQILRRHRRMMIGLPLFVFVFVSVAVFYGGTWVLQRRSKLFAPPDANRVFTQEDVPVQLEQRPTPGPDQVRKPGPEPAKAGEAIKDAGIDILDPGKPAGKDTIADGTQRQAEASEGDLTAADGTPARFSISNSTEAVADEGPVQNTQQAVRAQNKFTVETDGKVWIQVRIDDKKPQAEMLRPGDHREWVAAKSLDVVIGNAGGIRMRWNDQPLQAPRVAGRVLRFRLPDYAKAEQG